MKHSNDIKHLYDETYFFGGLSIYNGQKIGVGGVEKFKEGSISPDRRAFASQVDFKGKNVLDVGFGRGEILKYCRNHGAKSCVGIDYSPVSFEIASEYLKGMKVKLYQLGVDEFSKVEETGFEVVYMRSMIEHIPDTEWVVFLTEARKKFGKDCVLLALTPATRRGDYLQMHNNYQTDKSLRELFDGYFKLVEVKKVGSTFCVRCSNIKDEDK